MLAWTIVCGAALELAVRSREAQLAVASGLVEIGGAISARAIVFAFVRGAHLDVAIFAAKTEAAAAERFWRTRRA